MNIFISIFIVINFIFCVFAFNKFLELGIWCHIFAIIIAFTPILNIIYVLKHYNSTGVRKFKDVFNKKY